MNKNASILKDILCNGVVRYSNNARTYLLNISFYRFVYLFFTIIYNNCSLPFYEHFAALYGENARALVYLFFFFFFLGPRRFRRPRSQRARRSAAGPLSERGVIVARARARVRACCRTLTF